MTNKKNNKKDSLRWSRSEIGWNKKGKADYIAPLRPLTLAAVKPWGNSEGAGRVRLSQPQIYGLFYFLQN